MMLSVLTGAISSAGGILGALTPPNKDDPVRLADNARAFDLAVAGNADARAFLQGRTGRFGMIQVTRSLGLSSKSPTPGPIGGWATEVAKSDAFAKYNALVGGGPVPATPNLPAPTPLQQQIATLDQNVREDVAQTLANVSTGAAIQVGQQGSDLANRIDPARQGIGPISQQTALLAVGGVVALVLLTRNK